MKKMKRIMLSLLMTVGMLTAQADNYTYLTFETTDGAKVSVNTESLKLSISGNTLTAGDQQFTLTNLSKMYFSTSDESTTGIEDVTCVEVDEATEIYNLQGHKISKEQMLKGVYIVKTKKGTYKIAVK